MAERRTRVLTLIRDIGPGYGGAEMLAYEIARRLDRGRFESFVVTTRAPTPDRAAVRARSVAALREAGIETLDLGRRRSAQLLPFVRLHRFLRDRRIDVLHAHMFRANVPGSAIGRLAGVPAIVSHEHTWSYRGRPLRRLADRELIARASDVFVAVSRSDRASMIAVERIDPAKIVVVPNGIPDPVAHGNDVRSELGLDDTAPVIGALARLEWQKGYDVLVAAVALLRPRRPDLRVLIAGEGRERARLHTAIAENGLVENVRLLGHRYDSADFLAALDAVVMPSRWEGSPLALVEAMALGRPIVASAVGGIPDLITDEQHGLLVAPEDPHALAAALDRVLSDRALARRLGEHAQRRQRDELSIEVTVRRFERLYEELLGR